MTTCVCTDIKAMHAKQQNIQVRVTTVLHEKRHIFVHIFDYIWMVSRLARASSSDGISPVPEDAREYRALAEEEET